MTNYIRASDLYLLEECDRKVYLGHNGDPSQELPRSAYYDWIAHQGDLFEQQVAAGLTAAEPSYPIGSFEEGHAQTLDMMRAGVEVIYQGVLLHDGVVGIPDLMFRVDGAPPAVGPHAYRPVDIKFASRASSGHKAQVMCYVWLLHQITGWLAPGALFLRDRETGGYTEQAVPFDAQQLAASLALARRLSQGEEPRPFISSVCKACGWRKVCVPIAEASADVSLLPGMRRTAWRQLHQMGSGTVEAVSRMPLDSLMQVDGLGAVTAQGLLRHAQAFTTGTPVIIAPPELPPATEQDVIFDIESALDEGVIYLFGLLVKRAGEWVYEYDMAETPAQEQAAWHGFLERVSAFEGPVYHYSSYERTAIRQLAAQYGGDARVEALLNKLIDLEKVLKRSVALPLPGYSLKTVAPWLGFTWSDSIKGDDSIMEYSLWLRDGDRTRLERLVNYNAEDCRATLIVRDWLLNQPSQVGKAG